MKLPKIPKGLKARIARLEAKVRAKKAKDARQKEIVQLRKKEEALKNTLRKR